MKPRKLFIIFALMAIVTGVRAGGVYINKNTFPSDNFRNWVSTNCDTDGDGYLTDYELSRVTNLNLGIEHTPMYDLKGMEHFTELTILMCYECALSSLDLSTNTKLRTIDCSGNQLNTLDVSSCPDLRQLKCSYNNLTTLDLSNNPKLTNVQCVNNEIRGAGMDELIANLLTRSGSGYLNAIAPKISSEGNVATTAQVAAAEAKGWTIRYWTGTSSPTSTTADWLDYNGSNGSTQYKLIICGVRVTDDNKDDLSSLNGVTKGTITFDGNSNTLTLKDVDIKAQNMDFLCIDMGERGMTLRVEGTSSIHSNNNNPSICFRDDATITGPGILASGNGKNGIIVFDEDYAKTTTLTIDQMFYLEINGYSYGIYNTTADDCVVIKGAETAIRVRGNDGAFCNFRSITLNDGLSVEEPTGASVSGGDIVDYSGKVVSGLEPVLIACNVAATSENFPDANFLKWVKGHCDTYRNSVVTYDELAAVNVMDVSSMGIANLKGIEFFTALEVLDCSDNQLTRLDLSNNTALYVLTCAGNCIKEAAMSELVASLPKTVDGIFNASAPLISTDENVLTYQHILDVWRKGWTTCYWSGTDWDNGEYIDIPVKIPTDVKAVNADADSDSPFFSLDGQRINGQPTQKGVYVRNGKKVVIK